MANPVLNAPHFKDEAAAFAYVEAHLWPQGPECPHCGVVGEAGRLQGKTTRPGLWKCYACRKPFTVRMGTIFESSHLDLHLWLQVIHLMCASKKGISTRQIQRMLNCSMKTAWFLGHRIRKAMTPELGDQPPLGGDGFVVEADETYIGKKDGKRKAPAAGGYGHKRTVLSLVERGGNIISFKLGGNTKAEIAAAINAHVDPASTLHTDKAQAYRFILPAGQHESVDHSKEYVRQGKSEKVHTNTLEGFFSVFKRGMVGIYQHCGEQHLQRYLAEFDFRANTRAKLGIDDVSRASMALEGVKGKRLTYRTVGGA